MKAAVIKEYGAQVEILDVPRSKLLADSVLIEAVSYTHLTLPTIYSV